MKKVKKWIKVSRDGIGWIVYHGRNSEKSLRTPNKNWRIAYWNRPPQQHCFIPRGNHLNPRFMISRTIYIFAILQTYMYITLENSRDHSFVVCHHQKEKKKENRVLVGVFVTSSARVIRALESEMEKEREHWTREYNHTLHNKKRKQPAILYDKDREIERESKFRATSPDVQRRTGELGY